MTVGIGFTPFETRADVIGRLAVRADGTRLERVTVAEAWTHDATTLLAELACRTHRIGLGAGVLSVWSRSPATLSLEAAGLQRLAQGRFSLGLGASTAALTEGLHGIAWHDPVDRLRQTIVAVRALLSGERLPDAPAGARAMRIGIQPEPAVPLHLAALAPASVRLAGELADGWLPFLYARSQLQGGRALLGEGAARTTRAATASVIASVPLALGPDEPASRRLAAWWLTTYLTRMGPLYPRLLGERFGMTGGVDAVVEAAGAPLELPAAADALAEQVTLLGSYDDAARLVDAWFEAGADSVTLILPPGRPESELADLVDVAAEVAARAPAVP